MLPLVVVLQGGLVIVGAKAILIEGRIRIVYKAQTAYTSIYSESEFIYS